MLIDLHTHTSRYSWDSTLTADELIDLAKEAGLDGICLTEHDFFWDADDVLRLSRKHEFLVLPGVEINTDDGHILCYGLGFYKYGMHRVNELAHHVNGAGGVMVAAHPYRRQLPRDQLSESDYEAAVQRSSRNPAYGYCVALERFNGRGKPAENGFAAEVCDVVGLPCTAGSDAHSPGDIGRCATEFVDSIDGLAGLIEALRKGRHRPVWLSSE